MKKEFSFYTEQEITTLKHSILRGDVASEAAKRYSPLFHRSEASIRMKICNLKKLQKDVSIPSPIVEPEVQQPAEIITASIEKGVVIPKGLKFEGTPKKVVLYSTHFRVYF